MNKIPMLSSMSFLSLPMLVLAPICPSCWSSFTWSFTIKTKDIWIAGWYMLLMVQKSQTITWDVSNHVNNGINWCFFHQQYHHLMCFLGFVWVVSSTSIHFHSRLIQLQVRHSNVSSKFEGRIRCETTCGKIRIPGKIWIHQKVNGTLPTDP